MSIACFASGLVLAWTTYRLWVKRVEKRPERRFNEQISECIKTAEKSHDSLLQTIAASKMVVDDALEHPEDHARLSRAMGQLSKWLELAAKDARAASPSMPMVSGMERDLLLQKLSQ